jgi:uncharacterized protein YjbJ (UPF0337 family)
MMKQNKRCLGKTTLKNKQNEVKKKKAGGHTMKSSTKDNAEGKMHQMKGKIKEVAGKITGDRDLETEGKDENLDGKVQEKVGEVKKVIGK